MSIQITVRVPDDLVEFADLEVAAGRVRSRAELVARALRREKRRRAAEADAAIYAAMRPEDDDLAAAAAVANETDFSDLD
ncbi:MAG: hypothetical protein Q4G51_05930 [Dermatophilus congolensis]|nr:hypothetical protein [Dermatophilus congolensis]